MKLSCIILYCKVSHSQRLIRALIRCIKKKKKIKCSLAKSLELKKREIFLPIVIGLLCLELVLH